MDVDSPISLRYNIRGLPTFLVYSPNGRLMLSGHAAETEVLKTMQADIE